MTAQRSTVRYQDFRTNLDSHPVKGDLLLLSNEDAVKRSIRSILLTKPWERHWNPDYGAGLAALLFEPMTMITENSIRQSITSSINNFEPRAELVDVYVSADPDNNAYNATIVFYVINIPEPITLTVLLNRIR